MDRRPFLEFLWRPCFFYFITLYMFDGVLGSRPMVSMIWYFCWILEPPALTRCDRLIYRGGSLFNYERRMEESSGA